MEVFAGLARYHGYFLQWRFRIDNMGLDPEYAIVLRDMAPKLMLTRLGLRFIVSDNRVLSRWTLS